MFSNGQREQHEAYMGPIGVGQSDASRRLGCDPASLASAGTALKETYCVRNVETHLPSDAAPHSKDRSDNVMPD